MQNSSGCNKMSVCPLLGVSLLWRSAGCSKMVAKERHLRYQFFFFFSTRNSVSNYQVAISEGTPPLGGSQVVFHPSDRNLLYSILLHKVLALDTLYDGHPLPLQVYSPYLVY